MTQKRRRSDSPQGSAPTMPLTRQTGRAVGINPWRQPSARNRTENPQIKSLFGYSKTREILRICSVRSANHGGALLTAGAPEALTPTPTASPRPPRTLTLAVPPGVTPAQAHARVRGPRPTAPVVGGLLGSTVPRGRGSDATVATRAVTASSPPLIQSWTNAASLRARQSVSPALARVRALAISPVPAPSAPRTNSAR